MKSEVEELRRVADALRPEAEALEALGFDKGELETLRVRLEELKEADLSLSLVVSGIFDRVKEHCQKVGIHRHGVNYSLGIWGKTEKLPPEPILDVITMCGHGMVSANRIYSMVDDIKAGRKSAEDAAKELAKQCDCGVFNPTRAAKLLDGLAKKS